MTVLALIALLLWGLAFLFLFRVPVCTRHGRVQDYPSLSVIIPARDEEGNLPRLLASLLSQDVAPAEIIVVDDGSTDRTAEVAREGGATVLAGRPVPEGWRGKTWACMQGADAATGDVLLFVDADTFFEEDGLARVLDTFLVHGGAMSVAAYHRVDRLYEDLSAFFNLLMAAGSGAFTVFGAARPPAGFFGPFVMIEREAYLQCGGHASVRGKILEHYHFARVLQDQGVPTACYGGKGSFGVRMYPDGIGGLIEGWSKAFASGAASTPPWIMLASVGWLTGAILAVIELVWALVAGPGPALAIACAVYLLFALQLAGLLRRLGSFRVVTALLYPIPLLFYQGVFARSTLLMLFRKKVSWKGREIDADSKKE
ncbi:MAG: glycosyltransferase [Candidatus Hydrogenedentes bacterium]|nr:glycosyltransferase [Candidatus Hydrogenedentota bacterium]